jgi:putrescine transport system substrate-binding protein
MRIGIIAAGLVAAALFAGAAVAQDRVVNVFNWSDYIDPQVLADFTKETGIKVVYDVMDSNEVLETKLLAGSTGYDIVVPTGSFLQRQISAGVFQPLDTARIPNLGNAWDRIVKSLEAYDPGNKFAVNYMWGTTGIGYNVAKVKERLGDLPINSWDIVFKPEIASKLADCGIYFLDSSNDIVPAALNYLGIDPNSKEASDFDKAGELLKTIRPYIKKFNSSEYINALANGDICVAVGFSGDVFIARNRAIDAHKASPDKALVDINYFIPKEGALMWLDSLAIPNDAKNVAEAYAFIDYLMRPEVAARNTNFLSYANGNAASKPMIEKSILENPAIYPPDDLMAKLFTVTAYNNKAQRSINRVWTRFVTGQ